MTPPPLASRLAAAMGSWHGSAARPLLIGLGGAQGSGKTTLTAAICAHLADVGLHAASLSLDDVYLTRAARQQRAATHHPLFITRGPPGTHDLPLAHATIDALLNGAGPTALPRFHKPLDDRESPASWPIIEAPLDVLILEGWCLGATPTSTAAPINSLEALEDADGEWRAHIDTALADDYAPLWARFDRLIWLAAPDWATICRWRAEQEARSNAGTMNPAQLARFMMHYERITRAQLAQPPQADLLVRLGPDREVLG